MNELLRDGYDRENTEIGAYRLFVVRDKYNDWRTGERQHDISV